MRFRSVVLGFVIATAASLATWQWASAQDPDPGVGQRILSGFDIGFLPDREQGGGIAGERYVRGQLHVRVNGRWVPVEFTHGGRMQLLPLKP